MGRIIFFLTILIALASQIVVNDINAQSSSTWRTLVGSPVLGGGCWPTDGTLTQGPGAGNHARYASEGRAAVDISSGAVPIYSPFDGTVLVADQASSTTYGKYAQIQNTAGGYAAIFAHMSVLQVARGDSVKAGQQIGIQGETGLAFGIHLHYEINRTPLVPPLIPQLIEPPSCTMGNCTPNSVVFSLSACSGPQASSISDLRGSILSEFKIEMNGFGNNHLQWAYDKLKEVNSRAPRFLQLARMNNANGDKIIIQRAPREAGSGWRAWSSFTPGCAVNQGSANINLVEDQDTPVEEIFKITLIHEIAHLIQTCPPPTLSLRGEHANIFNNVEGGLSFYARYANESSTTIGTVEGFSTWECPTGSVSNVNEDYADMLAYYLHSGKQKDVCGVGRLINPYETSNYSAHRQLAQKILNP